MSKVRRAITVVVVFSFFSLSIFLFSINVVISSLIECMPVESPFLPPFPQILGVGVVGGGGCECVCLLYPSIFIFLL